MRILVLGSGIASGFPAWNDGSEAAARARQNDPRFPRREGAALAVSVDGGHYSLLESPLHLASTLTRTRLPGEFWEDAIQRAWLELAVRDARDAAIRVISEAETQVPLDSLAPLDWPYGPLTELLARAGAVERAEELRSDVDREIPPEFMPSFNREIARADGEIALARGQLDEAILAFRRSDTGHCEICALTGLGEAYDRAGQPDSAIAVYTRYVETPFPDRYASYAYPLGPVLGPVLERLGQLHDERGDLQEASRFFAQFVELWADADEELQPRVQAAQARLEEILREIG